MAAWCLPLTFSMRRLTWRYGKQQDWFALLTKDKRTCNRPRKENITALHELWSYIRYSTLGGGKMWLEHLWIPDQRKSCSLHVSSRTSAWLWNSAIIYIYRWQYWLCLIFSDNLMVAVVKWLLSLNFKYNVEQRSLYKWSNRYCKFKASPYII